MAFEYKPQPSGAQLETCSNPEAKPECVRFRETRIFLSNRFLRLTLMIQISPYTLYPKWYTKFNSIIHGAWSCSDQQDELWPKAAYWGRSLSAWFCYKSDGGYQTCCPCCLVTKSCLTVLLPQNVACQAPQSGIFQARILEWVGSHFLLQRSPRPRDHTQVSCIGRQVLYHWTTREAHNKHTQEIIWAICGRVSVSSFMHLVIIF